MKEEMTNEELQDFTWSVLPGEFKEEAKKMFNRAWGNDFGNGTQLGLATFFGKHNLTSTSDDEVEEMLTVSRKEIIELYQETERNIHRAKDTKIVQEYVGIRNILLHLFGSKCLPDEEKYTTCVHACGTSCLHYNSEESHCSLHGECNFIPPLTSKDSPEMNKETPNLLESTLSELKAAREILQSIQSNHG